jgi:hypothetical protein
LNTERFLSVNADVTMTIGDEVVSVRGAGESVTVEVSSVSAGYKIMRGIGGLKTLRSRLAGLSQSLSTVGLSVVIRTPSRKLMTLGQGSGSGLMKLLGLPNTQLHLS